MRSTTVAAIPMDEIDPAAGIDHQRLRHVFSSFPTGVVGVGAVVGGVPVGMAASSFTSVSLDPPLVSVCIDNKSSTWPTLRLGQRIGVSVLGEDHGGVCRQLAARSGDRFAGLDFDVTRGGAIVLRQASAWFECILEREILVGDHCIALLRVKALAGSPKVPPLVFHGSEFHRLARSLPESLDRPTWAS